MFSGPATRAISSSTSRAIARSTRTSCRPARGTAAGTGSARDGRKNLAAERSPTKPRRRTRSRPYAAATSQRAGARRRSTSARRSRSAFDPVAALHPRRHSPVRRRPQHPHRQHRHQRARERERRHHREPDRKRQRNEQRPRRAGHEERRDEHGDHGQHREQARHDHFPARVDHAASDRGAARQVRVDVLDCDGRLVHQNPHGERQAAERHDVDRLPRSHSAITAASSANGIVATTIDALRQSPTNASTIRPVSSVPENRLPQHRPQRGRHGPRLIELVAHRDVVGHERLEPAEVRPHLV